MTDPRLLVPLDMVPETWPAGLPVRRGDEAWVVPRSVMPAVGISGHFADVFADLSAPPTDEHGGELRLDALGWALGC